MTNNKEVRLLSLSGQVNASTMGELIVKVVEYNYVDDLNEASVLNYERKPITLVINSVGGNIRDGLGLIAAIEMSKTPVHTVCLGQACSMGLMIFEAGHTRTMHELSVLMHHQLSFGVWDNLKGVKEDVTEAETLEKIVESYLLKRSKLTQAIIDSVKNEKRDWFIYHEEALKYGLVDNVVHIGETLLWE